MQINITVVIQIINFLITYLVLKHILFKPIMSSLKAKKEQTQKLEESIKQKEAILLNLEKEKVHRIETFQEHAKETYPFITEAEKEQTIEIKTKKEKDNAEQLKQKIVDILVTKVPDAY